jgi:hypothetical protein
MKKLLSKSFYLLCSAVLLMQTGITVLAADEPPVIVDPFATDEPAAEPAATPAATPAEEPPALTLPPAETAPVVPAPEEPAVVVPPAETAPVVTTPAVTPAPTHTAAPVKATSVPIKSISKSGPEILVLALASALMGAGYRRFKKNK